jgi:hypothetical protein
MLIYVAMIRTLSEKDNTVNDIITLGDNLSPLKERFNAESSLIRFLTLLSPTCPL